MLSCFTEPIPCQVWNPLLKSFEGELVRHSRKYLPPALPIISIPLAFRQRLYQHFICALLVITERVLSKRSRYNHWLPKLIALIWCSSNTASTACFALRVWRHFVRSLALMIASLFPLLLKKLLDPIVFCASALVTAFIERDLDKPTNKQTNHRHFWDCKVKTS